MISMPSEDIGHTTVKNTNSAPRQHVLIIAIQGIKKYTEALLKMKRN